MKHCGTQRLETERLILKRFVLEDAAAMYKNWASDADVTKFLSWPTHTSQKISECVITDWVKKYDDEKYYQWAIVLKTTSEPIGSISVVRMNENISMAHIGYCIGKKWWHQGITSEALKAVVDFLFDEVGANRIESYHDPNNPNSGGVMKKCGMRYEGTLRSYLKTNQGIIDACVYAILKSER